MSFNLFSKLKMKNLPIIKLWLKKRLPITEETQLAGKRIFILPSKQGVMFCLFAIVTFVMAVNFENSLIHGLSFLLISFFIVALLNTYKNFSGLVVKKSFTQDMFVQHTTDVHLHVSAIRGRTHSNINFHWPEQSVCKINKIEGSQNIKIPYKPKFRGEKQFGFLKVSSGYPTGLFRAWSFVDLGWNVIVYPKPTQRQLNVTTVQHDEQAHREVIEDDFSGLNNYQPGDPLRRIAWKNVAKGQGVYIKSFQTQDSDKIWLSWFVLEGDVEDRLSQLCGAVLQLDSENLIYGMELPDHKVKPNKGEFHKKQCLYLLATFSSKKG